MVRDRWVCEDGVMTKRQLIDEILVVNPSAEPAFLADFDDGELEEYLQRLLLLGAPRITGDAHKYDRYFDKCPAVSTNPPQPKTVGFNQPSLPTALAM